MLAADSHGARASARAPFALTGSVKQSLDKAPLRAHHQDMPATTAHIHEVHTHAGPGFTYFARWIGRCRACKAAVRFEFAADAAAPVGWYIGSTRSVRCCCGAEVAARMVTGATSDKVCGARCMGATGPDCECSCGGANHGGR